MVDIPVSRNRLSVPKQYGGNVGEFCKETRYHLFGSTSVSFEFHGWVLIWEDPHRRLLLRLGVVLVYPILSPLMMSQTRGNHPPSNFLSMWVHQSTLPRFCSSFSLRGTQRAHRFLTPRQSWKMRVRLPDEIFMISCISAYVSFGSFLIRTSTLETFTGVTVVAIRPQRSSSSNVLSPDTECLNHLKLISKIGF